LHVRLACGVGQNGFSLRQSRRHHGVFRCRYRSFVQKNVLPLQAARAKDKRISCNLYLRAQLGKYKEVSVQPPPPDNVSAGRGQHGLTGSG
jgi:hypothetical protein